MTTCRDIITLALRQARVVGVGRAPRAVEAQEGLVALQSMYDKMFADGLLGPFKEVYATADYTAGENERIIADNATITIPDNIEDGGEVRTPKDLSAVVVVTDIARRHYVFSLGRWERADSLALDSAAPLAQRGASGLAAALALEYAEMFGASLLPATTRAALRFKGALSHRFSEARQDNEYY